MTSMLMDLSFLLGLSLWSAGVGFWILIGFNSQPVHRADALALAVPLGLGTLSLAVFALGGLGFLTSTGIISIGLTGGLPAVLGWWGIHRIPRTSPIGLDLMTVLIMCSMIGTLLTALTPVTDGDALCYHLQVPKVFLQAHTLTFDPDLHETIYPGLTEMLYVAGLAVRGPVACRLIQWLLGVSFAGLVTAIARPSLGDQRAHWAGAIALLVPAISNGMGAPLNDVALATWCNAAILTALAARARPCVKSAILAGGFAGLAIGVKYPALVLVTILIPVLIARKGTWSDRLKTILIYGLVTLLVGGCWYLRAYFHTGNPVYPFFRHLFGGSGLDEVLAPIKRPLEVTLWNLLTSLAPMTLNPDRFDSVSHQFGPVFLFFLPALLIEKTPRRVLGIVAVGYVFLVVCLTQRQSMRFVLTAVGPLSVGVAWLASTWRDRRSLAARGLVGLLVICLCFETGLALLRARHGLPMAFGRESALAFLDRREPTARVGRWVGEHLPASSHLIGQDHRGYYFPVPYTMELAHRRRTGLAAAGESPEIIISTLRERGFTHLLLCPPVPETAVEFDPTLSRRLKSWLDEHEPIYRESIADGDGVLRHYAIYDLGGAIRQ